MNSVSGSSPIAMPYCKKAELPKELVTNMFSFLKSTISNERIEGDTFTTLPADDVTALSILVSTDYLLCMERLLLSETSPEKLKSLKDDIPYQKEHILELWAKLKDPTRVQALAKEHDKKNVEEVRSRLLAELETAEPETQESR